MKKILYVTTISGFLPQFEMNSVRNIKEKEYEVHFASNFNNPIYSYDEDFFEREEIITHQLDIAKCPAKVITNFKVIKELIRIIDREQIDMVHCHTPVGGVVARIAGKFSKRKPYMIYTAHGFHFYEGASVINWVCFYPVERILAKWTDIIVTINREDFERAERKFKLKKNGFVRQIPGVGLDLERFEMKPELRFEKRKELEIPEDAFHIVTAAELNKNKNQKVVIEAIAKLQDSSIIYSICGRGPEEENLKMLVKKYHLEKQVRFLGFRSDMDQILQTADSFTFSSKREGLGMAAIEALACGIPVAAATNRGTKEYIVNGVNGILCNACDSDEFARALREIQKWVQRDEGLLKRCRDSVLRYGILRTQEEMDSIYGVADLVVHKRRGEHAESICHNGSIQSV